MNNPQYKSAWARSATLLVSLLLIGCPAEGVVTDHPVLVNSSRPEPPVDLPSRISQQLKLIASKAICSAEVRSLIRLLEHECGVRECTAEDLRALTRIIEPHQRFMWLMRDVPHVVVYLKDGALARPAKEAIVEERQERLIRLLEPPWLDFAQVWIVAHSSVKETNKDFNALERAEKVKQFITEQRFKKELRRFPATHIRKVSYDFPLVTPTWKQQNPGPDKNEYQVTLDLLNKNVVLKNDMPITGEPADPARGVWVFLVDCVGEL